MIFARYLKIIQYFEIFGCQSSVLIVQNCNKQRQPKKLKRKQKKFLFSKKHKHLKNLDTFIHKCMTYWR